MSLMKSVPPRRHGDAAQVGRLLGALAGRHGDGPQEPAVAVAHDDLPEFVVQDVDVPVRVEVDPADLAKHQVLVAVLDADGEIGLESHERRLPARRTGPEDEDQKKTEPEAVKNAVFPLHRNLPHSDPQAAVLHEDFAGPGLIQS